MFPKAFCKNSNCKLSGHTLFVCPRLSKCGADGVEQNPRSFFKGLHLPKLLQALPKGDGGKHTAAPVMLVAPSAPSLSAINFQEAFTSPEFQTALQTAIQAESGVPPAIRRPGKRQGRSGFLETPLPGPAAERQHCKDIKSHLRSCNVAQVSGSVDDLDGVAREAAAGQRESQQHFELRGGPSLRLHRRAAQLKPSTT